MKYDRFKNKMQNSSYRNKILLFKIPRFTLHETLAANRETFGPNEPEKFHEMRTSVRHFHETCCVHIHSVLSKGNEQVLGKEQGKQNNFELFCFCLILDVSEQRIIFLFSW
jgi:hypothetical protein